MKTQNETNKMTKVLFSALTAILLMTTACSKKNDSNTAIPVVPPVYPGGCVTSGCMPSGGQLLYGGTTVNTGMANAQFEVYGNVGGNGPGSISGVVNFNNFVCQVGVPNLQGSFQIQMNQPGTVYMDVFQGTVALTGPQATLQASIQVVPSRYQGSGLFSLYICGQRMDMNF